MKKGDYYIGIMSGTSLDAVDVVFCKIDAVSCRLIKGIEFPFDPDLKAEILGVIAVGEVGFSRLGSIDHRLGRLFADAANALLSGSTVASSEVMAIGSHGQTLWHEPDGEVPFTLQLGDPNVIAARTGIPVVADFRRKDMALGGQGAPFAPAFHAFLFGKIKKKTAVVNIGGMANVTILGDPILGYDTGCGNVLFDVWIAKNRREPYDKGGAWAASGKVDQDLLAKMLSDPYFLLDAPKSTGRERFNMTWLEEQLQGFRLRTEDVQATLLELTAQSIASEVKRFDRELLLLCGGGAKNSSLITRIGQLLPQTQVATTDEYGVSGDFMEAMTFAWLAYKRIHRERVDLKAVTGARENTLLGGLYE